jgi:hypothetical protein
MLPQERCPLKVTARFGAVKMKCFAPGQGTGGCFRNDLLTNLAGAPGAALCRVTCRNRVQLASCEGALAIAFERPPGIL